MTTGNPLWVVLSTGNQEIISPAVENYKFLIFFPLCTLLLQFRTLVPMHSLQPINKYWSITTHLVQKGNS